MEDASEVDDSPDGESMESEEEEEEYEVGLAEQELSWELLAKELYTAKLAEHTERYVEMVRHCAKVESELQMICDTVLDLLDRNLAVWPLKGESKVTYQYRTEVDSELQWINNTIIGLMGKNPIAKVPPEEYSVRKLKAKEYVHGANLVLEEMVEGFGKTEMGQVDAYADLWDDSDAMEEMAD